DRETHFDLVRESETEPADRVPVVWSGPPASRVGEFRFRDVPAGRYVAREAPPKEQVRRWRPASVAAAPGDEVELECLDDVPAEDVVVKAFDAATGRAIPSVDVWVGVVGSPQTWITNDVEFGGVAIEALPRDQPIVLSARAEGYRAEMRSLLEPREGTSRERVIEFRLESGWSLQLVVVSREGRPLPGATVLVDGEEIGRTGSRGEIAIRRSSRPRTIRARLAGYEMDTTGYFDAETGAFKDMSLWPHVRIYLRPVAASAPK
ncbi:MAG TPA: hypothetical protein VKE69_04495, partial [Planctomycetota bacterium]|nr:hypothetical protein [Planctomycetota bacterium]